MHFGQVANFKTNSNLPIEKFPIALNSNLKKIIRIKSAEEVDEKFHSRIQIQLYKSAIELIFGKRVKEAYLYSFRLEKSIPVQL